MQTSLSLSSSLHRGYSNRSWKFTILLQGTLDQARLVCYNLCHFVILLTDSATGDQMCVFFCLAIDRCNRWTGELPSDQEGLACNLCHFVIPLTDSAARVQTCSLLPCHWHVQLLVSTSDEENYHQVKQGLPVTLCLAIVRFNCWCPEMTWRTTTRSSRT